jgi:spermidine synthase
MKPTLKLATTHTPDGGEMVLYQHDHDFLIKINGLDLMNSRQHESEQELARLGCAHLADRKAPCILIGGLGLGYTLRQALDLLGPAAKVVVSELLPAVVDWNRTYLAELNRQALADQRTELITGDIFELLSRARGRFDAILLDVDNGPSPMTDAGNQRLYSPVGIQACRRALRQAGCLAVWSTEPSPAFEQLLRDCGFYVRRYRVKAYPGSRSKGLFIWVAAQDEMLLPTGDTPFKPGQKATRAKPRDNPGKS